MTTTENTTGRPTARPTIYGAGASPLCPAPSFPSRDTDGGGVTLERRTELKRGNGLKRSRLKSKPQTRDWSEAIDKKDEEGRCRVCLRPDGLFVDGQRLRLECAHTIDRAKQDEIVVGPRGGETLAVKRESTVPLCGDCHRTFDARRLDLLPFLLIPEQVDAVRAASGIDNARRRLSGERA